MGESFELVIPLRPVALCSHDAKVQVDFLYSQKVYIFVYYYVVYFFAFFVSLVDVESIDVLECDAKALWMGVCMCDRCEFLSPPPISEAGCSICCCPLPFRTSSVTGAGLWSNRGGQYRQQRYRQSLRPGYGMLRSFARGGKYLGGLWAAFPSGQGCYPCQAPEYSPSCEAQGG